MNSSLGTCDGCGQHSSYLLPLHGERGGPLRCFMCAGAWHAKHGRRRRAGRVLVKALKAYEKAGGKIHGEDFNTLKLAASGFALRADDKADTAGADICDLTLELLADTLQLTHPDRHAPEHQELAKRVTAELLALRPFIFAAPPPEPPPKPCDGSSKDCRVELNKPSQPDYPCEDCRGEVPANYCNACMAQYDKKQEEDRKREDRKRIKRNARQRELYVMRRHYRSRSESSCATCGKSFKPKRSDTQYCSHACRQRAYLNRDGNSSNFKPLGREYIEHVIESAFRENLDGIFTSDQLCKLVYPGLKKPERKHRAAVVPIAKQISERLGEHRTWLRAEVFRRASRVL